MNEKILKLLDTESEKHGYDSYEELLAMGVGNDLAENITESLVDFIENLTKELNLCDLCKNEFSTCKPVNIIFGNGFGNDNVIKCDSYKTKNN